MLPGEGSKRDVAHIACSVYLLVNLNGWQRPMSVSVTTRCDYTKGKFARA